jgi:O-succinylbenzoate synthase
MDVVDVPWVIRAELIEVRIPLVRPLTSADSSMTHRNAVLLCLTDQSDNQGWAECGADNSPYYLPESSATAWDALENIAIPNYLQSGNLDEDAFALQPLARSTALGALLDLTAARNNIGFSQLIGGTLPHVEVGAVLGKNDDLEGLLSEASAYVDAGYRRLKLKISPGFDQEPLRELRNAFSDMDLAADANGS